MRYIRPAAISLAPQIWFAAIEYRSDWNLSLLGNLIWSFRAPHSMLGGGIRPVSVTTISNSQANLLWNFRSPIHKASVNMVLHCLVICIFLLMKRKGQVFQVQLLYWQLNTPCLLCVIQCDVTCCLATTGHIQTWPMVFLEPGYIVDQIELDRNSMLYYKQ